MLLIPRGEGVETKLIKTSYSPTAGTAFVSYDNVKVPIENLLGKENKGLQVILSNFNHERWYCFPSHLSHCPLSSLYLVLYANRVMCCASARTSRFVVEECLKWSNQRQVFGKTLLHQPVIRQKLAKMIALVEACQSWLENVTNAMCNMNYKQQSEHLAGRTFTFLYFTMIRSILIFFIFLSRFTHTLNPGQIALLKMFCTRAEHEIADDAVQIFGGRGITRTGMGKYIEMFHRTYKFNAILGGAEEVLSDLGVRQAMRSMPKAML